eukprot:520083-Rhodomonas_salina.1
MPAPTRRASLQAAYLHAVSLDRQLDARLLTLDTRQSILARRNPLPNPSNPATRYAHAATISFCLKSRLPSPGPSTGTPSRLATPPAPISLQLTSTAL